MKKFIIGMTGIALCVCLTACGKSATPSSVSNLSNQLDSTANALSSISSVSPTEITLDNQNKNDELYQNSQLTKQSLLNEQYYKTEILERTANLKNNLANVTLSKMQKSAINDLTNTLNKYTSAIQNSKYEMSSSAKAISSMKKNTTKNEDKLRAKYNRLACNSNMRSAYYENILNTLDEIENCLNCTSKDCTQTQEGKTATETKSDSQPALKKNIDTYQNEDDSNQSTDMTDDVETLPVRNNKRRPYFNPNRNNTIYNRYERFNPSRNTDTYGPNRRNIDSFAGYGYNGGYGYGYNNFGGYGNRMAPYGNGYGNTPYGYGNNFYAGSNYGNRMTAPMPTSPPVAYASTEETPEKRLETFEKANPDNTVEKIEKEEESLSKTTPQQNDATATSANISSNGIRKMKETKDRNELDREIVAH